MKSLSLILLASVMLMASGCIIDKTYKPTIISNLAEDIYISVVSGDGSLHEGIIEPCVKMDIGGPNPSERVVEIKIPDQESLVLRAAEILGMAGEQESAGPTAIWVVSEGGLKLHGDSTNIIGCAEGQLR